MRRFFGLIVVLMYGWAQAQTAPPPPPATEPNPCAVEGAAENDPRCREQPVPPVQQPVAVYPGVIQVPVVIPSGGGQPPPPRPAKSGGTSGGSSSGGGLGSLDGRAFLVLVAIAVAALPAVVYALDDDAEPAALAHYEDFHVSAEAWGGAMTTSADPFGLAGVRGRVTHARIGAEASFEGSPFTSSWRSANAAFLLRVVPKQHVEIAFSIGGRWSRLNGVERFDGEFAIPHRYVLFRSGDQTGGIELRPSVLVSGPGADIRLDAGLVIPLGRYASLNASARFFTYNFDRVNMAFVGGLSARF